ncbi:MAG: glycogen synthase GlgA [Nitrospinae bacterium]|nr:glycogen synthase GlgA [Nitrospinota bacterium]
MNEPLKICIAASEVAPFAKTGGLADVAGALPKALRALGHRVAIIMPRYQMVDVERHGLRRLGVSIEVPIAGRIEKAELLEGALDGGVPVYFIEKPSYYDRPALYGTPEGDYHDNAERFIFFSRGVLEAIKALDLGPQVLHCNDWQTGLAPVYLKTLYREDSALAGLATVFSVHNLGYQGLFWHLDMPMTGLGWELFTIDGLEFYGKLNFLKGGLMFADVLSTVSETYAKEIQTEEFGHRLDGVLRHRSADLYGIVNGIDYEVWNPATDSHLGANYTPDDLAGKAACKKALQKEMGLPTRADTPVVGIVSRLAAQKGLDLIVEAMGRLMALGLQLVILGSGEAVYHEALQEAAERYPRQLGLMLGFDEGLAHRIEAGADMFLMPSRYEPCGLNQLYSLKYGTIPVVRATGGLEDTIVDYSEERGEGTGFKFRSYVAEEMVEAVARACRLYSDQKAWRRIVNEAMAQDFSWDASARAYDALYRRAIAPAAAAR